MLTLLHRILIGLVVIVLIASLVVAWRYQGTFSGDFALGVFTTTFGGLFLAVFSELLRGHNLDEIRLRITSRLYPRAKVRFSLSYLYRIQVDDTFLLIRNFVHGNVSPVGGVYKYFESARAILDELKCTHSMWADINRPNKFERDLRLLTDLRYASRLLEWFLSGSSREYCPSRELTEELLDEGLLPRTVCPCYTQFSKYGVGARFRRFDPNLGYYSFHWFDIFSVMLTPEQTKAVREALERDAQAAGDDPNKRRLFLASVDEIQRGCLRNGQRLGDHTQFIL